MPWGYEGLKEYIQVTLHRESKASTSLKSFDFGASRCSYFSFPYICCKGLKHMKNWKFSKLCQKLKNNDTCGCLEVVGCWKSISKWLYAEKSKASASLKSFDFGALICLYLRFPYIARFSNPAGGYARIYTFLGLFLYNKTFLSPQKVSGSYKNSYRKLRVYTFTS